MNEVQDWLECMTLITGTGGKGFSDTTAIPKINIKNLDDNSDYFTNVL